MLPNVTEILSSQMNKIVWAAASFSLNSAMVLLMEGGFSTDLILLPLKMSGHVPIHKSALRLAAPDNG
jgi:hypothetical protein